MTDQNGVREAAIKRLKDRRDFRMHLGSYVIVNAMFLAIWAVSGGHGAWPFWVALFWGVAVALHGWHTYFGRPITEDEIRHEMEKDQ